MVFLLAKRWEILYGTSKFQKKISTGTQNLCQSHTIQYIKLKKNGNFKMGNLTLTEILSAWRDLFWILTLPSLKYKPHKIKEMPPNIKEKLTEQKT